MLGIQFRILNARISIKNLYAKIVGAKHDFGLKLGLRAAIMMVNVFKKLTKLEKF